MRDKILKVFVKLGISKESLNGALETKLSGDVDSLLINCQYVIHMLTPLHFIEANQLTAWGLPLLSGSIKWVDELLSQPRGRLKERDTKGRTLAHYAALSGNKTFVKRVLGKLPELCDQKDYDNRTLAYYAMCSGNEELVQYLYHRYPQLFRVQAEYFTLADMARLSGNVALENWVSEHLSLRAQKTLDQDVVVRLANLMKCYEDTDRELKECRSRWYGNYLDHALNHTKRDYLPAYYKRYHDRIAGELSQAAIAQENAAKAEWQIKFARQGVSPALLNQALAMRPENADVHLLLNHCDAFKKQFNIQFTQLWQLVMLTQNSQWINNFISQKKGGETVQRNLFGLSDGAFQAPHYLAWCGTSDILKKQIKNYYTDNNTDKLPLLKCAIMGRQEGCIEFLLKQFPQLRHSKLKSLAQQYGIDYSGILSRVREKTLPNCVLALTKNDDVVESLLLLKMMADENYANTKEMYQAFLGNYITRLELQLKYRPLYEDKRYPLSVLEVHNSLRELAEHGVHEAESFFKKAFDHQGNLRPGFFNKPTESTATNSDAVIDLLPFSPS